MPAWLLPPKALSSQQCPWCPLYFLPPLKSDKSRHTSCTTRNGRYAKTVKLCYQKVLTAFINEVLICLFSILLLLAPAAS